MGEKLIGDGVAVIASALVGCFWDFYAGAVGASVRGGRAWFDGDAAGAVAVRAGHVKG